MRYTLTVHLSIEGSSLENGGDISARKAEDIVPAAYDFIKKIKYETGYRKTVIEKVMLNGEHDITDLVLEIKNRPFIPLDDVWW